MLPRSITCLYVEINSTTVYEADVVFLVQYPVIHMWKCIITYVNTQHDHIVTLSLGRRRTWKSCR